MYFICFMFLLIVRNFKTCLLIIHNFLTSFPYTHILYCRFRSVLETENITISISTINYRAISSQMYRNESSQIHTRTSKRTCIWLGFINRWIHKWLDKWTSKWHVEMTIVHRIRSLYRKLILSTDRFGNAMVVINGCCSRSDKLLAIRRLCLFCVSSRQIKCIIVGNLLTASGEYFIIDGIRCSCVVRCTRMKIDINHISSTWFLFYWS